MRTDRPFECHLEVADGRVCLQPVGDLDIHSVDAFKKQVARALDVESGQLVVDLSELAFLDSTGLNALAKFHGRAIESGRDLVFSQPTETVRRILAVVGLDRIFRLSGEPLIRICPVCESELPRAARWCPRCRSTLEPSEADNG